PEGPRRGHGEAAKGDVRPGGGPEGRPLGNRQPARGPGGRQRRTGPAAEETVGRRRPDEVAEGRGGPAGGPEEAGRGVGRQGGRPPGRSRQAGPAHQGAPDARPDAGRAPERPRGPSPALSAPP